MVDCPCGLGKNIPPQQQTCPVCGTDLAPLRRLKTLAEQIREEREQFAQDRQEYEKKFRLLKKGIVILPAAALLIGIIAGSAFRTTGQTEQHIQYPQAEIEQVKPGKAADQALPAATATPEKSVEPANIYYTIKKRDTLSKISSDFYGDGNRWEEIYEANRDKIKNPHIINEGTEIVIPYDGSKGRGYEQ